MLAHWTRLLASLGRIEALEVIFKENSDRVLDQGPLSQMWSRTREAYAMMRVRPEIAYRCGTFAMANVGRVLYGEQVNPRPLWREPSPPVGFTLAALTDFSLKHNLNLVAVHRGESLDLVVPSVVHWAQDHYAAIVEQVGDLYKVVDPTFGEPVWLEAEAINAEASGYLLVHAQQVPAGWRVVPAAEAAQVVGRGYYNTECDDCDQRCETCPCPPSDQSKQDKKDRDDGNRDDDQDSRPDPGCADCQFIEASSGMVTWSVSEPYINLWLADRPMSYQPSRGPRVECKLRHKQRDESAGGIPNATS
ncbi:MAG: hypothetical protein HYZ36_06085, partial [Pedosphaera parvula]|nr:hypothetical protein [Pedosphaera parvula]